MNTEDALNNLGINISTAKAFIYSNIDNPTRIYNIAASNNISFNMIAEIIGESNITSETVKSFFNQHSLNTDGDYPQLETEEDIIDLSIESILDTELNDILISDWDQILTNYQSAIDSLSLGALSNDLNQQISSYDWSEWASEFQSIANAIAPDDSWLPAFKSWYESLTNHNFEEDFIASQWNFSREPPIYSESGHIYVFEGGSTYDWDSFSLSDFINMYGDGTTEHEKLLTAFYNADTIAEMDAAVEAFNFPLWRYQVSQIDREEYLDHYYSFDWQTYLIQVRSYNDLDMYQQVLDSLPPFADVDLAAVETAYVNSLISALG